MSYTNNNLVQIFMNLLREKHLTQALLLDAPWGSGKTHFIKHQLIPALEKSSSESGSDYEQILYISLFGMSQPEEITDAIYSSYLAQVARTKIEKETGKRISKSINFTKLFSVGSKVAVTFAKTKGIDTDTLPTVDEFFTPHSTVVIFDDLERCKIAPEQLYGYVNNLIEHSGIKVILVANMAHFDDQDTRKQQEKLIGITKKYRPNYLHIYYKLINSDYISIDSLKKLLSDKDIATWTIDKLTAFGHLNLRTLIYALVNFNTICKEVEHIPHSELDVWDSLLLDIYKYTLLCSIRLRSGDNLEVWKRDFTYPLSVMFHTSQTSFSTTGFHFVNTLLTEYHISPEYKDTITYHLDTLSRKKRVQKQKTSKLTVNLPATGI